MGLNLTGGSGVEFEICPEGTYIGRVFQIIDLGTVKKTFGTNPPKDTHEIRIGFEVLDDSAVQKDGKPFRVGSTFTASLNEKANLRKAIEAIRGKKFTDEELKGFMIGRLMNVYCQLTIVHGESNGNTYANISSYSPLHKSMVKPDPINENILFDLDSDDYMDDYGKVGKYYQERIAQSNEWKMAGKKTPAKEEKNEFEDDLI